MMTEYKTVTDYARDEFVEKKSRFIGSIMPCSTEEEALAFIDKVKKEFWDASHNVYAYILKDAKVERCSDDGEPQGTGGRPALDVLQKEGLTNICVVATRYYGGIMLGAGGLVRAYSHTSKVAVDAAQIMHLALSDVISITFDYSLYGKISYILPDYGVITESSDFGEHVDMTIVVKRSVTDNFVKGIIEATNGKIKYEILGEKYQNFS